MNHRDLVAQSLEELRSKTAAHDRLWRLGEADWSVDQHSGEIVFSTPDGIEVTCSVQIIGTFDTNAGTWLWAWDHPSVEPQLAEHARRLHDYGTENGVQELTTRLLPVTEEQCWEFTALACKLNDAQGGYRGPAGTALVFMTFGAPRLSSEMAASDEADEAADADDDAFAADIPDDVRVKVEGFIQALHDWEVAAYQESERDDSPETMARAKATYADLLRAWCVPGLEPQSLSFGSEPSHRLETERLVAAADAGDFCRVRTQQVDDFGFASNYEYHLRRVDGEWRIEQLYYLVDGEKFESL